MRSKTVLAALAVSALGAGGLLYWLQSTEEPKPIIKPRPRLQTKAEIVRQIVPLDQPAPEIVKPPVKVAPVGPKPTILPGSVIGRVVQGDSAKPVLGAKVWISGIPHKKSVDELGRFHFPIKPDPKVKIVAFKPGYKLGTLPSDQKEGGLGLVFRLEKCPVGSIEGEVSFGGEAPERFKVLLDSDAYEFPYKDGRFRIPTVNAGSHMIGLAVPGKGHGIPLQLQPLEVIDGQVTEVTLTLPSLSRVRGQLLDENARPIGPGIVKLGRVNVPVGNDGAFDCDIILPGAYRPQLFHKDYGSITAPPLNLGPGEFRDGLTFTLTPAGFAAINGRIEAEGVALERQRITLRSRAPVTPLRPNPNRLKLAGVQRRYRTAYADASGAFRFAHLGPGRYSLEATLKDGRQLQKEVEIRNDETLDIRLVNE